jgi:hypothetical protein
MSRATMHFHDNLFGPGICGARSGDDDPHFYAPAREDTVRHFAIYPEACRECLAIAFTRSADVKGAADGR